VGDVGAAIVGGPFDGAGAWLAVPETAEAKKKNPANAILLSMTVSCGELVANDAGPPTARTERR
jgi:hypothetical protein